MKTLLISVLAISLIIPTAFTNEGADWLTNFDKAKQESKTSGKYILMSFSGSDWCANCIRLDRDLFQQESFQSFAAENLILLKLDFPAKKQNKLSAEQTAQNEGLAEKYNKQGVFPLVLVVDADGNVVGHMQHPEPTAEAYISSLKSIIGK